MKRASTALVILTLVLGSGCAKTHYFHPDPRVRIEHLDTIVRYLTTLSPPRSYDHRDSMMKAAAYIAQRFAEYGLSPVEQEFIAAGMPYVNIVASAGPKDGSRLIVGAHYDVCGDQPGADDNASAIAGLLEVARFAKEHESELPYRIDFVAYALEEPPFFRTALMGSYVHAESLHKSNVKVKAMICLEMIGFFTDEENSQTYPSALMPVFLPKTGNFIAVVSNNGSSSLADQVAEHLKTTDIRVETVNAPASVTGIDFSDHLNYWAFGYHAVMVTDTAFFRNPNYHKKTDTIDTLNFRRMREVVKGICWSILNMK